MQNQTVTTSLSNAKSLRKNMTDAERKLWQGLRGEQLGVKFRRQHPYGNFILDFVCMDARLIVEVDGSQHVGDARYDEHRTQKLRQAGFEVLRFWNNQVLEETDAVLEAIWNHLNQVEHGNPSPPQPSTAPLASGLDICGAKHALRNPTNIPLKG
ncbi:MAG: endonuclease domain-containing protein [Burkholderiales bacterium]|nr:endonuclease domain-containing protein [Burkholderiales bacterium]